VIPYFTYSGFFRWGIPRQRRPWTLGCRATSRCRSPSRSSPPCNPFPHGFPKSKTLIISSQIINCSYKVTILLLMVFEIILVMSNVLICNILSLSVLWHSHDSHHRSVCWGLSGLISNYYVNEKKRLVQTLSTTSSSWSLDKIR